MFRFSKNWIFKTVFFFLSFFLFFFFLFFFLKTGKTDFYEVLNGHRRYVTHPTDSDSFDVACHSGDGTAGDSVRVSAACVYVCQWESLPSPFSVCHSDFCAISVLRYIRENMDSLYHFHANILPSTVHWVDWKTSVESLLHQQTVTLKQISELSILFFVVLHRLDVV